jgi:pyruvate,water dikinase
MVTLLEGAPDPAEQQAELATGRERSLAEARERLADAPDGTRERFERGLAAATIAIRLHEDHHFWIDASVTHAVRCVLLEAGRRLAPAVIPHAGDVFHLTPAELREGLLGRAPLHDLVGKRRDEIERFASVEQPPFLGPPPEEPPDDPFTRMMARMLGFPVEQHGGTAGVGGNPGSAGVARGRARIIASLDEVDRLGPGDVLVTPMTTPPWTPLFARVAAVVTDVGGILSHAAVVAREYGIPAVVGTGIATAEIPDGALVEVDGTAGTVRVLSQRAG